MAGEWDGALQGVSDPVEWETILHGSFGESIPAPHDLHAIPVKYFIFTSPLHCRFPKTPKTASGILPVHVKAETPPNLRLSIKYFKKANYLLNVWINPLLKVKASGFRKFGNKVQI